MIVHEQTETKGRFYIKKENELVGELTYSKSGTSQLIINHTEVSEKYRGQDYAKQLVFEAVKYAKSENLKVIPVCSYAKVMISKHKEL